MPAMTLGSIWDRINSAVITQNYARSLTPFDFEQQPDGRLDHCYHCTSERIATEGYLGGYQAQHHLFTIFLAQRIKREAWGAYRQLLADLEALESAIVADSETVEYSLHDDPGPEHEINHRPGDDYVIGQLRVTIDFDRQP